VLQVGVLKSNQENEISLFEKMKIKKQERESKFQRLLVLEIEEIPGEKVR
jgi:hypothetical protein